MLLFLLVVFKDFVVVNIVVDVIVFVCFTFALFALTRCFDAFVMIAFLVLTNVAFVSDGKGNETKSEDHPQDRHRAMFETHRGRHSLPQLVTVTVKGAGKLFFLRLLRHQDTGKFYCQKSVFNDHSLLSRLSILPMLLILLACLVGS